MSHQIKLNITDSQPNSLADLPEDIQKEVDILTEALNKCPNLILRGRMFNLQIAISDTLKELMLGRHGYQSDAIISNTYTLTN